MTFQRWQWASPRLNPPTTWTCGERDATLARKDPGCCVKSCCHRYGSCSLSSGSRQSVFGSSCPCFTKTGRFTTGEMGYLQMILGRWYTWWAELIPKCRQRCRPEMGKDQDSAESTLQKGAFGVVWLKNGWRKAVAVFPLHCLPWTQTHVLVNIGKCRPTFDYRWLESCSMFESTAKT